MKRHARNPDFEAKHKRSNSGRFAPKPSNRQAAAPAAHDVDLSGFAAGVNDVALRQESEAAKRRAAINEWQALADGNHAAANLCDAAGDHQRAAEHRAAAAACLAKMERLT